MKRRTAALALTLAAFFALVQFCSSARAAQGNLYDGGLNSHNIYKFTAAGAAPTVFYSNTTLNADSLVFDSKGNLLVADAGTNSILKITPAVVATTFAAGVTASGLAFDAVGNLYATDAATNSILKFTPAGVKSTFKSGLAAPIGLAFDQSGNLYVTLNGNGMAGNGSIAKITPAGALSTFATGLFVPQGIVVDNSFTAPNIYEADLGTGSIFKFTSTGVKSTFASSLSSPRSLAFDRFGNLYVGEFGANPQRITKITAAGAKSTFGQGVFVGGLAFEPPSSRLGNISTRASVQTGDGVTIVGFIVNGTAFKKLIVRGIGPSLSQYHIAGALQDPTLELHKGSPVIATNDNWQTDPNANQIPTTPNDYRPDDSRESALLRTLSSGSYSAILSGKNSTTGIGLAEVYDLDSYSNFAELTNVSTRAFVGTNDAVAIGGFISNGGNNSVEVLIRGLGPTLSRPPFNVPGTLANPTLKLVNANGTTIASNDNWKTSQQALIEVTGLKPPDDLEAAILASLPPANYTAILSGVNRATGIGLVEVYKVLR